MPKRNTVIVKDLGYARIMRTLRRDRAGAKVVVGFTGPEAEAKHEGGDGDGQLNVVSIAAVHEFGSADGRVPQRSMLRDTMDLHAQRYRKELQRSAADSILGRASLEQGLERLGVRAVGDVQKRINAGIPPELAASTVAKKGSSKQLIDTAQMKSAVTYEVRRG